MGQPTIVFVHGDYHGGWCWDFVRSELSARPTVAVELPSSGLDPRLLGSRQDDVVAIRRAVATITGPVLVVAHSAGGIATSEALAAAKDVLGVIFVAALVLQKGQTAADVLSHSLLNWAEAHLDEQYVRALDPVDTFYRDVEPDRARTSAARLTLKSIQDASTPATTAIEDWGWPSAYVVCRYDRAISPLDEQTMAQKTGLVRYLDSSHSPFLSMPTKLVSVINECLDRFVASDDAVAPPS